VLETLTPAERLAFVLHDMFGTPFEEIAAVVGRSPQAARQLASRARRRVRAGAHVPDMDLSEQWAVVDAFLAAAREGNFDALLAVLHADVVLRADTGAAGGLREVRGAVTVASQALTWSRLGMTMRRARVNGAAGLVGMRDGKPFSVSAIAVRGGKIVEIDILGDPKRLAQLGLSTSDR
jgi:RNA polymerase sigma-70 factor (ECF subfamily)